MPKLQELPIRLAFRVEGEHWNCYLAGMEDMQDALFLGSIRMSLVEKPGVRDAFMNAMKLCMSHAVEEVTGHKPDIMFERPAPEKDRTKE